MTIKEGTSPRRHSRDTKPFLTRFAREPKPALPLPKPEEPQTIYTAVHNETTDDM